MKLNKCKFKNWSVLNWPPSRGEVLPLGSLVEHWECLFWYGTFLPPKVKNFHTPHEAEGQVCSMELLHRGFRE